MKNTVHVYISGKVQGVWYRASTKQKAEQLGIKGWVRNLPDGRVEAFFQGDNRAIEEIIKWCNIGPKLSKVTDVVIDEVESSDFFSEFKIK